MCQLGVTSNSGNTFLVVRAFGSTDKNSAGFMI